MVGVVFIVFNLSYFFVKRVKRSLEVVFDFLVVCDFNFFGMVLVSLYGIGGYIVFLFQANYFYVVRDIILDIVIWKQVLMIFFVFYQREWVRRLKREWVRRLKI